MSIKINAAHLYQQGNKILDAMDESRREHDRHLATMEEHASGWVGESASALAELRAHLEERNAALHQEVGNHGMHAQEVATKFRDVDDNSSGTFKRADA